METNPVRLNTFLSATTTVVTRELIARAIEQTTPAAALAVTAAARLLAIGLLLLLTAKMQAGLEPIGLAPGSVRPGLRRGVVWSTGFGGLVALCFGALFLAGVDPLKLIRVPLPEEPLTMLCYFGVGGILAPLAEEIYFRGLVYGFLRRWGPAAATLGSTLLFVAAHSNLHQIPLPQVVGGILFAVSYEVEKKLMVPVVIHAAGNIALFSLSIIQ